MNRENFWNYILLILSLTAIAVGFFTTKAYADSPGYINGDGVNFRDSPNGNLLATYDTGKSVTIVSIDGDWTFCSIDGVIGYVWSEFVSQTEQTPIPDPEVTPSGSQYIDPTPTPEPTSETETEPEVTPVPTVIPESTTVPEATAIPTVVATEVLEPTPVPTTDPQILSYQVEQITVLANIQGILIFFTIVILCFFVYKFLRMFF